MSKSRLIVQNLVRLHQRDISTNIRYSQKATDPIQQLYLDKLREYMSKSVGGKLVDVSPEILNERQSELDKLAAMYGGGKGVDMSQFPQFKFADPPVDVGNEKK